MKLLEKIVRVVSVCGLLLIIVVSWAAVRFEIREAQFDNALEEYDQALAESKESRSSYHAKLDELEQILMSRRMITPSEEKTIKKRMSEIKEKIKKAKGKLARAWEKFCGLAGKEEPMCREKQEKPAPKGFI